MFARKKNILHVVKPLTTGDWHDACIVNKTEDLMIKIAIHDIVSL